jgi:hypothetical protein
MTQSRAINLQRSVNWARAEGFLGWAVGESGFWRHGLSQVRAWPEFSELSRVDLVKRSFDIREWNGF